MTIKAASFHAAGKKYRFCCSWWYPLRRNSVKTVFFLLASGCGSQSSLVWKGPQDHVVEHHAGSIRAGCPGPCPVRF